jgi:outer membrane protein assembly factor BamD
MRLLLLLSLFLFSCSFSDDAVKPLTPQGELAEALKKMKDEEFESAKNDLYAITIKYSGTKIAEDAQYYLGEVNFKMGKYLVAATSYRQIIERYTNSKYLEKAQFKEAMCFYNLSPSSALDQKYTYEAIRKFREFQVDWPSSENYEKAEKNVISLRNKLAKKVYKTASLYFKMSKWKASNKYIDFILTDYKDTDYIAKAQLLRVQILIRKKQFVQAEQFIALVKDQFPELKPSEEILAIEKEISEGKAEKISN